MGCAASNSGKAQQVRARRCSSRAEYEEIRILEVTHVHKRSEDDTMNYFVCLQVASIKGVEANGNAYETRVGYVLPTKAF
jgi:hypothetical protein